MNLLKRIFKRLQKSKKEAAKTKVKGKAGYRSPEEFHADFERRFGKPGRIPEDV